VVTRKIFKGAYFFSEPRFSGLFQFSRFNGYRRFEIFYLFFSLNRDNRPNLENRGLDKNQRNQKSLKICDQNHQQKNPAAIAAGGQFI